MSEREVSRLAFDLHNGNAAEAASICRQELQANPQLALQEIRQANAMAGQGARLHVGTRQSDGDMALVDQNGQAISRVGNANQAYNNYDRPQFNGNYPQDYPQQGFPQAQPGGYDPRQNGDYWANRQQQQFAPNYGQYNNGQERMEVQRLAQDLAVGNTGEAKYIAQDLLQRPDGTRALQAANQMADMEARQYGRYGAAEHAYTMNNGEEVLVSDRGRVLARCGNVYEAQNMIGPTQFSPMPASVSQCYEGQGCYGPNNGGYNGQYFNGGYPPGAIYPNRGFNNNVGSLIVGTGIGLTIASLARGFGGGYHGRGRR